MAVVQPYTFSDFYGYDQDCSTLTSFSASTSSTFSGVCSATVNQTYYHDGSFTNPDVGDTVYSNSGGTTYLSAGYYLLGPIGDEYMQVGSSGTVSSVDVCFSP